MHELNTGILIERDGRSVATVETSKNTIEITVRRGGQRAFAASRAGLRSAVDLLARYVRIVPKQPTGSTRIGVQADLFACAPKSARTVREQEIEQYVLAALRRAARRRTGDIDAIEAAVSRENPTPLVFSSAVLDDAFFTHDVVRFRAAAVAAAFIETLPMGSESPDCAAAMRPRFQTWRRLFCLRGEPSRALNKTLAQPPADAAAADLWALRLVHLERPVRSDLHLRVLAQRARGRQRARDEHLSLIQHAEEGELVDLRARVARALGLERASESERDHVFAEVIAAAEAPARADGLRALVRRSIVDAGTRAKSGGLSPNMPTRAPPIPPPAGARFLATVGELTREGELMHHCVGSHARDAAEGEAFIFHVEANGEHATVEVDQHGRVTDAAGPRNEDNRAVQCGKALLTAWGSGFWAARVGALDAPTWKAPGPPLRVSWIPVRTIAACLVEFHRVMSVAGDRVSAIVAWFEDHAERAAAGDQWIVACNGSVIAIDARGKVIATLARTAPAAEHVPRVADALPPLTCGRWGRPT